MEELSELLTELFIRVAILENSSINSGERVYYKTIVDFKGQYYAIPINKVTEFEQDCDKNQHIVKSKYEKFMISNTKIPTFSTYKVHT